MIKKGNKISLDYEGRFESGEVFDTSEHGDHSHPLIFEVGSGRVIPGFDKAVIGMKKGEEKEFEIEPEEAYGKYRSELAKKVPKSALPPSNMKITEGMMLMANSPDGVQFPVRIAKVEREFVVLDMNHPLAGKKLIFKIKILDENVKE